MKLNEYIEITNEDNMELMARYPDKYFDIGIIDPPYGIGFDGNTTANGGIAGRRNGFTNKQHHVKKGWDNERPSNEYFEQLRRVSKNQIIWGGNYFADLLPPKKGWIFWDKKITNANNKNFSDGELAWTSFDCILRRFTYDWIGFGYLNNPQGEKKIHPTQKPIALYAWILKNYAKQGDKIIDTHFGSGSIACAVHNANIIDKMDLSLVACELDKDYFERSIQRVKAALQTQSLF
jgi:site-specific DNA-methyltransferase (adenine-specific)